MATLDDAKGKNKKMVFESQKRRMVAIKHLASIELLGSFTYLQTKVKAPTPECPFKKSLGKMVSTQYTPFFTKG